MSENITTVSNTRPVHVTGENILMFIRLTSVFNKVDDLGDKVRQTQFVNSLEEAKAASRTLTNAAGLGYVWMTQRYDHLLPSGEITRTEVNYQWTKRNQWVRKDDTVTTVPAPSAADASPEKDEKSPF